MRKSQNSRDFFLLFSFFSFFFPLSSLFHLPLSSIIFLFSSSLLLIHLEKRFRRDFHLIHVASFFPCFFLRSAEREREKGERREKKIFPPLLRSTHFLPTTFFSSYSLSMFISHRLPIIFPLSFFSPPSPSLSFFSLSSYFRSLVILI